MFPPRPEELQRLDGAVVIPARAAAAFTRILRLGVEEGRRRRDPMIDLDMNILLDAILTSNEESSPRGSASATTVGQKRSLESADEMLTVSAAAARHGCSELQIRTPCSEHRLAAVKVGRDWQIRAHDLDAYRFGGHHDRH